MKLEEQRLVFAEQQLQLHVQREQHTVHLCQLGIIDNATLHAPSSENEQKFVQFISFQIRVMHMGDIFMVKS